MPLDPPPLNAPLTMPKVDTLTKDWTRWLLALHQAITAQPAILGSRVNLTSQNTSIGSTALPVPSTVGGFYRVNAYLHITALDAVSGSVSLTLTWTETGVSRVQTIASVTQATPGVSASVAFPFIADQGAPITYSTTYASNTPGVMRYRLGLVSEQL